VNKPTVGLKSGGGVMEPSMDPNDYGANRTKDPTRGNKIPTSAAMQLGVSTADSTAPATEAQTQPSQSYEGMTGGGSGLTGAQGLRRAYGRYRRENRTSAGTNNFRRYLQIGAPNINLN